MSKKFCKRWHLAIIFLHLIAGCGFVIAQCVHDKGNLMEGVMLGIVFIAAGAVCFFIMPIMFITISIFVRFLPAIAPIIYFVGVITKAISVITGIPYGLEMPFGEFTALCFLFSAWGIFNIWTARIANDENFNPITLFE